jgi:tRNA pseudouridine38-40 synthase
MMRYRATLAYDGSAYNGFQRQIGDTPTIQLVLEQAIARVVRQPVTVLGAGRTDTGVHATGQVIAFDAEWKYDDHILLKAINANLPLDIVLQDIRQQPGFHPRFDALSRQYQYRVAEVSQRQPLIRNAAWQLWGNVRLKGEILVQVAALLVGEHDFAAFGKPPRGENTIRSVYSSEWRCQDETYGRMWTYTVEANAFLQHMVRRMVALMVKAGRGQLSAGEFERIFRRATLIQAIPMAPPQGLTLAAVRYPE